MMLGGFALSLSPIDFFADDFTIERHTTSINLVFSEPTVTGNVINGAVNGIAIPPVSWATSHAVTLQLLADQIALLSPVLSATVVSGEIKVVAAQYDQLSLTGFVVSGGATQATITQVQKGGINPATGKWENAELEIIPATGSLQGGTGKTTYSNIARVGDSGIDNQGLLEIFTKVDTPLYPDKNPAVSKADVVVWEGRRYRVDSTTPVKGALPHHESFAKLIEDYSE